MIPPLHWRCVVGCVLLLSVAIVPPAIAQETLYDRLGGQTGVARIVQEAMALFMTDDRVKDDFDNINPDRLRARLSAKICEISGGPCAYKGRSMAAAHKGLDLTQAKFNAVAEDVQTAMQHVGISYWTQNRLMARLAPMQRDIVTR